MANHLVMKFGGAGLADGAAVAHVCELVSAEVRPILVVSAHAGVTSQLESAAVEAAAGQLELGALRIRHKSLLAELRLDPELLDRLLAELGQVLYSISERRRIEPEELDFVLSFGERMSARVVAAALRSRGLAATPVDAFDLGLTTDSCHGHARPLPGFEQSVQRSLEEVPGIPVVTGFLAKDPRGNLTTLGRDGSDLTAALVARALGAQRLVLWKCVPGLMSADPAVVPEARVLTGISLREAAALAFHGARVLHASTLGPVLDSGLRLELKDIAHPGAAGSVLDDRPAEARPLAVTGHASLAGLRITSAGGEVPATLFPLMHAHHVSPRSLHVDSGGIELFAPRTAGFDILCHELGERAVALPELASVAVIGGARGGAGARAFALLASEGIEPRRAHLSTDGLSQAFLVRTEERDPAMRLLHAALCVQGDATPATRSSRRP